MPNTRLILHVKGTEAETSELPKEAVRAAISEGKITHSQLIWIPTENTWKPVRELPELLPVERLILHVKGTESETTELPKKAVKAAISEGKLSQSQLIWSPEENTWKPVREMPELLPSQKLAPAPVQAAPVAASKPVPVEAIIPESPVNPVARAAAAASTGTPKARVASSGTTPQARVAATPAGTAQPRVATASAATPQVRATTAAPAKVYANVPVPTAARGSGRSTGSLHVEEEDHHHPFKWICIGLGAIVLLVVLANYCLVDYPLRSNLGDTSFSDVTVHGHFGAFMQPNVMVIHIPNTTKLTPENLTAFLAALARSTPQSPFTRDSYARISLTSGWTGQYSFSGNDWKQLGDMERDSDVQRKDFVMAQMGDAGGQPIMPVSTLSEELQQKRRDQAWNVFVANFVAKR